ncbi:MAG: peptidoglycan-associated lipoprotein Pal [candidate division KSB1 bacterium]|nr:peptidoglycan-associated lipoprotein Pal [candidate division KSB1 bacterium]MDZ7367261.1 peptidoglycan-associated lipoprotein Pal [candidate division KSB1 bacterium]MDZ7405900.1 peptidoglycan-associated lipoprotein Pal [candidate division KSB1 bacterium]
MSLLFTKRLASILSSSLVLGFAVVVASGCGGKRALKTTETPAPQATVAQPERQPETRNVPQAAQEETAPLVLENVYFDFDQYALTPMAREILASHARALKQRPEVAVVIEGHCDERGTVEYNLALGDKRAKSVKNYLVSLGVDGSRLTTISYGKERPIDFRRNEEAWAKNRRAEFVIKTQPAYSETF